MSQSKVYYSTAGALILNVNKGHRIMEANGISRMVDQKIAEFTPMQDGYGRLYTEDPEVIEFIDRRIAAGATDVFDHKEYARRTTPAEVRLKMMEADYARILEDHNRLLAKIQEDAAAKPGRAPSR